jgi:hypothetical protein
MESLNETCAETIRAAFVHDLRRVFLTTMQLPVSKASFLYSLKLRAPLAESTEGVSAFYLENLYEGFLALHAASDHADG